MAFSKDKVDKPFGRLIMKLNKITKERGNITDAIEIKGIIRDYYKQLYTNKLDKVQEMNEFLKIYNLPRKNQEIESLNGVISTKEFELIIRILPRRKIPSNRWLHW